MSNLTVDQQYKIETRSDVVIISNPDALLFICPRCTNTRNVYLHRMPTHEQMLPDVSLETGTVQHPMFRYCRCEEEQVPARYAGGILKLLIDLHNTIAPFETVEDVKNLLKVLIRQEANGNE